MRKEVVLSVYGKEVLRTELEPQSASFNLLEDSEPMLLGPVYKDRLGRMTDKYQPFDDLNRLLEADGWPPMIMNQQVYSRLFRALGWKEWVETKGKRGNRPTGWKSTSPPS